MLRLEVITQLSPDDRLVKEWSELATTCQTSTIFQTAEWLVTWWNLLGKSRGQSAYIVTVRSETGTLIGLFPLILSRWYLSPIMRLSFMGAGVSDYVDAIALPGHEDEVCDGAYRFLVERNDWSVLDMREVREGSLLRSRPPLASVGLEHEDFSTEPCPYIDLDQSVSPDLRWQTLLSSYSKKMRGNIGYYERILRRTFRYDEHVVESEEELESAFETLFELHQRRWNRRWLPGVFSNPKVRAFHLAAAKLLLKKNWLRLHLLSLDDQVEAALYGFAFNDRTCYYQGGFEPELAKYSLGTVLISAAIKQSALEGFPTFDFLRGDEEYKQRWTLGRHRTNIRRLIGRRGSPALATARQIASVESWVETRAKLLLADGIVRRPKRIVSVLANEGDVAVSPK